MKSSIPIGNGTNGTTTAVAVDMVDHDGHAATNGKTNGHTNGYSETNGKAHNGNGVAHHNGHSETGISKSKFTIFYYFTFIALIVLLPDCTYA